MARGKPRRERLYGTEMSKRQPTHRGWGIDADIMSNVASDIQLSENFKVWFTVAYCDPVNSIVDFIVLFSV